MSLHITFPDGAQKEFAEPMTALEIAKTISNKLAKRALAAEANGQMVDLTKPLDGEVTLRIFTFDDEEGKHVFWHSSAHVMAQAIKRLFPDTQFAIGPAIKEGFYYDVDSSHVFVPEDMEVIQQEMLKIAAEDLTFTREELPRQEALEFFTARGEGYKQILINDLPEDAVISTYTQGDFTDLCRGPHLPRTGFIKAAAVLSFAGAYWRGDAKNKMLQRIYAITFPDKKELDAYLFRLEEAKKRDHRKLGKELDLFMLADEGPGFPFFLPKGMLLRNALIDYWRKVHDRYGYVEISTPIILNQELWHRSGHWDHYKDNMYTTQIDGEDYAVKPMNCPGGMLVYRSEPHSYRDLPLRVGELGLVHRHELSGALHGLFRVRCFTQDDAHIFMMRDQMKEEIQNVVRLFDEVYSTFGLNYQIEVSTMPEDHIGDKADWDFATETLKNAITDMGKTFVINEGDGAFYGPKLDFHLADSLGRTWQCGTIQLDFQMPERFKLEYVGEDNQKHRPVMIHRVVLGSIERFIGIITEHFAGAFPLWLSPVQAKVLTITENQNEYAEYVTAKLKALGLRVEADIRNEKLGYKIREARNQKTPYILVVGGKEAEDGTLAVRRRGNDASVTMTVEEFAEQALREVAELNKDF
ncbi:MAG TPA: threonine--tRNA ligase [Candidatus Avidehalobacter gallistercoris]|uniref:Threonine--tRNA ligase n=1 Tax=Candidatus Avidehalobacter gallistercoris TaxID=2840694 RepID=A0A9D1HJL8_9FIRM|nr:threonine--tRNA ligase [Candidatus Avidehalobacter gallistercoris]